MTDLSLSDRTSGAHHVQQTETRKDDYKTKKREFMKTYIKPEIKIQKVVVEQLLASESKGEIVEGLAKPHDNFWTDDDFFDDTTWPKDKSPWD